MTVGFGFPATLFLLGLVVLVFVLFSAAAKDAGYKLNLGNSKEGKRKPSGNPVYSEVGPFGPGWYRDNGTDYPTDLLAEDFLGEIR